MQWNSTKLSVRAASIIASLAAGVIASSLKIDGHLQYLNENYNYNI